MSAKVVANLIVHELLPRLKKRGVAISQCPVTPEEMAVLAQAKAFGILTTHDIRALLDQRFAL